MHSCYRQFDHQILWQFSRFYQVLNPPFFFKIQKPNNCSRNLRPPCLFFSVCLCPPRARLRSPRAHVSKLESAWQCLITKKFKFFCHCLDYTKICRCLAVYSLRHNLQPTGHKMSQKCQYLAKNANFGPSLAIFVPNILFILGGSKSFGTHIPEKPPRHLVCIVLWSGTGPNGPKRPVLCQIWPFLGKNTFLGRGSKTYGTLISGNQWDTSFMLKTLTGEPPMGR